ncbi:MAG: exosortase/archaeosortase family protein [Deltaproteobacteria bacterium]|nr:exosortase/archaeosortase family protein [Deltaproteobacteria bacterium]
MNRFERVLGMLVLLAFAPAFFEIVKVSGATEYGSHAPLVPLVALWLALRVPRSRWPALDERHPLGLSGLLAGAVLYGVGIFSANLFIQGLAFVVVVAGALAYVRGVSALRAQAFPVGFLFFMIPLPVGWVQPIIFRLQLWVSEASVALLQAAGHVLLREGNVLVLPGEVHLGVEEACSGITSVLTLIPLGLVIAHLMGKPLARQWVVILAIVPVAMLGNLLRVVMTVALAEAKGVAFATGGSLHTTLGLFTYLFAISVLLGLAGFLREKNPRKPEPVVSREESSSA